MNYIREGAAAGERFFYPIYTEADIAVNPNKADTGLFFFRGKPGARFAVCNAGGGFAYVGAMHDSFPHALELSRKSYNAFARPGAQTAAQELARAIAFIHDHAAELEVDPSGYSLWGYTIAPVDRCDRFDLWSQCTCLRYGLGYGYDRLRSFSFDGMMDPIGPPRMLGPSGSGMSQGRTFLCRCAVPAEGAAETSILCLGYGHAVAISAI